jgi:hypothetical protein
MGVAPAVLRPVVGDGGVFRVAPERFGRREHAATKAGSRVGYAAMRTR